MMLSTRLFTLFLTFTFIFVASEIVDARTIQKRGRNYFESVKRVTSEDISTRTLNEFSTLETSLALRLLDQMKAGIYAHLMQNGAFPQRLMKSQRLNF